MRVHSVTQRPLQTETPRLAKSARTISHPSSISYGKKRSVMNCLMAPWNLLRRVAAWLWGLICCCRNEDGIDWEETNEIFETIYAAVFPAEHGSHVMDRQKVFNNEYEQLSDAAKKRFKEHICLALAIKEGKKTKGEQERWAKEIGPNVNFEDYRTLAKKNDVLREAVKAFRVEIENNI